MSALFLAARRGLNPAFVQAIEREFQDNGAKAVQLTTGLLAKSEREAGFARQLAELARDRAASWELRRLAILMLEHLLQFAPPPELMALMDLLELPLADSAPLVRRVARLARAHKAILRPNAGGDAIEGFLETARHECRLTLARYFFSPEEVVARIRGGLRTSSGLRLWTAAAPAGMPDYERRILELLTREPLIYWCGERTSQEVHSLVEYPLGTIVLTIKPPGSDYEFEIKRAGMRGANPFQIKSGEGESAFSWTHRLQGASVRTCNDAEAYTAQRLQSLYQAAHGKAARLGAVCTACAIRTIPSQRGEVHLLDYFTDPLAYGEGYDEMRSEMALVMDSFEQENPGMQLDGDLGLTVRFLSRMPSTQAILAQTTSFRLDLLSRYLSSDGPGEYFTTGLGRTCTVPEARRFAEQLLCETLGTFHEPVYLGSSYEDYLNAVFSNSGNRQRANRLYTDHLREIGRVWGTLMATGGYSNGESFVERNVGLRARWTGGRWKPELIFMDHDGLNVLGENLDRFQPTDFLDGMRIDERYIFGHHFTKGLATRTVGCLQKIYRPDACIRLRAAVGLRDEVIRAYRKTRAAMRRPAFLSEFLDYLSAWEELVWSRLSARGAPEWENIALERLTERGIPRDKASQWINAAIAGEDFFRRYRGCYDPRYLDFRRSKKQVDG